MFRKIYNRLSFMAVSWLDESTLLDIPARYSRTTLLCLNIPFSRIT
jgi:hypothetical protein